MKVVHHVTDNQLLYHFKEKILVGSAFAFIKSDFIDEKNNQWMKKLFNATAKPGGTIIPLLGRKAAALPGTFLACEELPSLNLRAITADKMLYQTRLDSIHLMIFAPELAGRTRTVVVQLNGSEHSRSKVALGKNGQGALVLSDLSAGQYSVCFEDETQKEKSSQSCQFTVADYKLAPLVASLTSQQLTNGTDFAASIKVESFGTAVTDAINVQLLDGVRRVHSSDEQVTDGKLTVNFKLEGQGPHQIILQLKSDATKTANVPITGSRQHERESTIFSPLSTQLLGSLLPTANSREVRGIYLADGVSHETPIAVKSVKHGRIEFTVLQDFDSLMLVAVDPLHPKCLEGSKGFNRTITPHPAKTDSKYKRAEAFFHSKEVANALAILEECSDLQRTSHPYYEYLKACCHAILGDKSKAMTSLRNTVQNGWPDYDYFAEDADLKSLHEYEPFIAFCNGGIRETSFSAVKAGQIVAIDTFTPACIVAIGGYLKGAPWEGWTSAVAEETIVATAKVAPVCVPGKAASITWEDLPSSSSVYCIIKDRRLITIDNARSRLASRIKDYVGSMGAQLIVGSKVQEINAHYRESISQSGPAWGMAPTAWGMPPTTSGTIPTTWGMAPTTWGASAPVAGAGSASSEPRSSGSPGGSPISGDQQSWASSEGEKFGAGIPRAEQNFPPDLLRPTGNMNQQNNMSLPPGVMSSTAHAMEAPPSMQFAAVSEPNTTGFQRMQHANHRSLADLDAPERLGLRASHEDNKGSTAHTPRKDFPQISESNAKPEVLFAGFVAVREQKAALNLELPDLFADYVVESFVTTGDDWYFSTVNFCARKQDFIDLNVPLFSTLHDYSRGVVYFGTQKESNQITVTRNGEPVALSHAHSLDSTIISKSFQALPGEYCARLISDHGTILDVQKKIVQEPGKLTHRVKAMRLLSKGDSIEINDLSGVEKIEVLPDVSHTFNLLIDATADYSHCCCEQTASKIIAAVAMYLISSGSGGGSGGASGAGGNSGGGSNSWGRFISSRESDSSGGAGGDFGDGADAYKRDQAESIIIAGIKREESMWVKGQGLKTYPESTLCAYLGAQAARHLWNLEILKNYSRTEKLSDQLIAAVNKGLAIAQDVCSALSIEWPPKKLSDCADAYAAATSATGDRLDEAITFVNTYLDNLENNAPRTPGFLGTNVYRRQQSAFAAAVLLQSRQYPDQLKAFTLTDSVTRDFNAEGRLYSTVDSAAAIGLFSEMRRLNFGSGGIVKINNGQEERLATKAQPNFDGGGNTIAEEFSTQPNHQITRLEVLEGTVAIQTTSIKTENWSQLSSQTAVKVQLLNQKGDEQRKLKMADSTNLVVTISDGYKVGDLLWVYLPEALSRVFGGGQVKMFSIDFEGKNEIVIPLAATGLSANEQGELKSQHLAVCLRNMFDEERCGNPGLIAVTVQ